MEESNVPREIASRDVFSDEISFITLNLSTGIDFNLFYLKFCVNKWNWFVLMFSIYIKLLYVHSITCTKISLIKCYVSIGHLLVWIADEWTGRYFNLDTAEFYVCDLPSSIVDQSIPEHSRAE